MQHHATLVRHAESLAYQHDSQLAATNFVYDRVGVGEVAKIITAAQLRPSTGSEQVFVIQTMFITLEAQNALLKLFEEPPIGLQFVLVVPLGFQLLPTLQSRIGQEHNLTTTEDSNTSWEVFYASTPADRITQIEQWHKTKEPQWLQAIAAGVHTLSHADVPTAALPALRLVGEKLATRGASNKMLLEHLALAL